MEHGLGQLIASLMDLLLLGAGLESGLPPGWKVRAVGDLAPPAVAIEQVNREPALRLSSSGQAAWFYKQLARPQTAGRLRWEWLVDRAPAGATLSDKDRDDSPIRVFVIFGKQGGLLRKAPRILFYSFGGAGEEGHSAPSHVSDRFHIIARDGADAVGEWREHEVDPQADFRRVFGREPQPITAIGVMQDTDQTGAAAVAFLKRLEWIGAIAPAPDR